jgi:hypothetical protein
VLGPGIRKAIRRDVAGLCVDQQRVRASFR